MLIFATPRPKKIDNIHDLEENEPNLSLKISEKGGDADTFQQTFSARVRRREKKEKSPEQCSRLVRTLPPLGKTSLKLATNYISNTLPLCRTDRNKESESIMDHETGDKKEENSDTENDSDENEERTLGDTTDVLNMDQKMPDEEATYTSSDDDHEKVHDENKDCEKEEKEPDAAEYYEDQALDEEEQSSLLCENEEKNLTTVETTEKDKLIPDNSTVKQACENAEIHTENNSSQATTDNQDRISGRLLDKAKRFSFFKRRSMKQKNAHSCDESKLENLPQSEQDTENQANVSAEMCKDENQNHTGKNQRGSPSIYQNRKSSSTCVIL
ncbi:PREDICTED: uncharacterized protein LOC106545301 isoform X3 [Thamnophis sirtalis]|uniref:Uncharacterized protein LOC106545301 isoform X3 n=2 Tax=Thamnophis TaxID=34999 RepID=A0A6I9Y8P6_9SAUR|nr:PREDICTED: uncharacterized protein LOC106545301 isoform X3 [Thamnophis sirtalis]